MILEGIVTTINDDGTTNISPMGPAVDVSMSWLILRLYQSSTTYHNLKRSGEGVLHVTDDVELLARAAIGRVDPLPELLEAEAVQGRILADACRWYAFRVRSLDESNQRAEIVCDVVDRGRLRDFFGFNRAKHAVVEAAILATRTAILPRDEILQEYKRLAVIVEKTASEQERRAFSLLDDFVQKTL